MKTMISKPILIMTLFLSVCIYGQVPESERAALTAFYEGTSPELWRNTDNWGTDEPVSNWYGVTVSEDRVTELRLGENRLRGPIPPELWTLTELTHLDLFRNNLEGTISSEIGNLSNLRVLKIGGNFLNGTIPEELWALTELTELSFTGISTRRTALRGPISAELGNLTNLTILSLSYTHSLFLEAGLPEEIGQLQSLRRLYLRNSSLSGEIPSVLGTLNNLEHLNFRLNNLSGAIPPEIATLPNLEAFNVSGNRFDFADLEPTFTEFQEKEDFIFDYLPQYVGRVDVARTELVTEGEPTILRVSEEFTQSDNNRFQWYNAEGIIEGATGASYTIGNGTVSDTGTYHYRITNTVVTGLTLRSHDIKVKTSDRDELIAIYNITGGPNWINQENWDTDAPLSDWYGVSVNEEGDVIELNLRLNNLTGDLPSEIGGLKSLRYLNLNYNNITSLPESFGNHLENLYFLSFLHNNSLTSLPESFGNLESLRYLDLTNNALTSLPENFGNLEKSLEYLGLGYNALTSLPESFGNLESLVDLVLEHNALTTLLESFGDLGLRYLSLNGNALTSLPESFGNLKVLRDLDLRGNALTTLPESFGNLESLYDLSLGTNALTSLPESFGNLEKLEYLDLRGNELTSIPGSIKDLENLEYLTLNNNYLHFDDIETISNTAFDTSYSPQEKVGEEEFITVSGETVTLRSALESRRYTNYKWFKDGVEIDGARGMNYVIENTTEANGGIYHYEATDLIVTELTLRSNDIHLTYSPGGGSNVMSRVVTQTQENSFNFIDESSNILFPNPANIGSDVTITGIHAKEINVKILNMAGIPISEIDAIQIRNNEYSFNTSNLLSGVYIVKIINKEDNNTAITKRMVIGSGK